MCCIHMFQCVTDACSNVLHTYRHTIQCVTHLLTLVPMCCSHMFQCNTHLPTRVPLCFRHVFPMLSLLKADCSPEDLEEALQEAMDLVDVLERRQDHSTQQRPQPADDKEKAEEFVREMLESGFSKTLALKAMKEVDVEDVAEGEGERLLWGHADHSLVFQI